MLESLGARGKRLGVENQSYGLTHANGKQLDAALEGFCKLSDASDLVNMIRVVKSAAELKYVRKAGELGDAALKAAVRKTKAGADEGEILAAQQAAVFAGGGDYPANEFIIGSGRDALLCRYKSGRRKLGKRDQLTLEWAGVYRHYHAAFMRTLIIGKPTKHHVEMDAAAREALAAVEEQLRPGRTAGDVFDAHARVMDEHGMKDHRLNACGYSLGAKFTPSWMDAPDVLQGQSGGDRPRHGVLRAHDPDEFRGRRRLLPWPHLHHWGKEAGAGFEGLAGDDSSVACVTPVPIPWLQPLRSLCFGVVMALLGVVLAACSAGSTPHRLRSGGARRAQGQDRSAHRPAGGDGHSARQARRTSNATLAGAGGLHDIGFVEGSFQSGVFGLSGNFQASSSSAGVQIVYQWQFRDGDGVLIDRIDGDENAGVYPGPDPWAGVSPAVLDRIARRTAEAMARKLNQMGYATRLASLTAPPAELFAMASPDAHREIDFETLNGPGLASLGYGHAGRRRPGRRA